jgi:hypothetical protein
MISVKRFAHALLANFGYEVRKNPNLHAKRSGDPDYFMDLDPYKM